MLRLPLDFSVFKELREKGYLYVDKTHHAYNLITRGKFYFLSRPRRFGKSLFVSMLKELLIGNKELFKGLWIDPSDYPWKEHGVIVLNFSGIGIRDGHTFRTSVCHTLQDIAQEYHLSLELGKTEPELAMKTLVKALKARFGKVAILIDEYDHPILHALQDEERARSIRDAEQLFFAALKSLDEYINFVFITGVSSFTKAGLFSGINNLQTITLEPDFAAICGYTQHEVDSCFVEYIEKWAQHAASSLQELRSKIKEFYNGYSFGEAVLKVYNPFSLMYALDKQKFENFWFESGTPGFLVHELKKEYRRDEYNLFDPETFRINRKLLTSFDVGETPLPALMFQSGYLTVTGYEPESRIYSLGYPNIEVKESMYSYLVAVFAQTDAHNVERDTSALEVALQKIDIEEAIRLLRRLFMHVPYQLHVKEEKFYHALLHMIFNLYGMRVISEQAISHGRVDIVVSLKNLIYVIEIKFNDVPENALKQIEDMRYYEPFVKKDIRIILLGLAFNRSEKKFEISYAYKEPHTNV